MTDGPSSLKNGSNMGYYTSYGLSVTPDKGHAADEDKFYNDLLNETAYSDGAYDIEVKELIDTGGVWAKLYNIEDKIAEIAKSYPYLLIALSGDGEDSDDNWEMRCRGDICELHRAEIPPFTRLELMTEYERKEIVKQ